MVLKAVQAKLTQRYSPVVPLPTVTAEDKIETTSNQD